MADGDRDAVLGELVSNRARVQKRFGQAVLARRGLLKLTQEEAADRAQIGARSWRDLEAGKTAVAIDVVERVIAGLDWSWADVARSLAPEESDGALPLAVRRMFEESWRGATQRERETMQAILSVIASRPS
jgi:transcriptional regulator with XRE-family HTH domain